MHRSDSGTCRHGAGVRLPVLLCSLLGFVLTGCDDNPFDLSWSAVPDTVLLYSLARPELNLPAGIDLCSNPGFGICTARPVVVEAATSSGDVDWDLALDTQQDQLVFLPPLFFGIESKAGVAPMPGQTLDDVTRAPRDTTAFIRDRPVPLVLGSVYVVRTKETFSGIGPCVRYAKLAPIAIDATTGTLRLHYVTNPFCNDIELVPPEDE